MVQEEAADPLQIKEERAGEEVDESAAVLPAVKSEDEGENRETTEPLSSTSVERVKTLAVDDCGTSQQPIAFVQLLSSNCSDSDTEDSEEWEESAGSFNALKSCDNAPPTPPGTSKFFERRRPHAVH